MYIGRTILQVPPFFSSLSLSLSLPPLLLFPLLPPLLTPLSLHPPLSFLPSFPFSSPSPLLPSLSPPPPLSVSSYPPSPVSIFLRSSPFPPPCRRYDLSSSSGDSSPELPSITKRSTYRPSSAATSSARSKKPLDTSPYYSGYNSSEEYDGSRRPYLDYEVRV